ncbi:putative sugar phosphate transporter domain-containing protein [Helianthus debilis subsp. tardiflorus]
MKVEGIQAIWFKSTHSYPIWCLHSIRNHRCFTVSGESAYEADRSDGVEKIEAAKRVKIGVYFATWWFLNVIFNIYNKKVLNVFPYPWLTSTLSLAAGSAIMLISWATKVVEAPNTDLEFWKYLFPFVSSRVYDFVFA